MIIEYNLTLNDLMHASREWETRHWKVPNRIVSIALILFSIFFFISNSFWYSAIFMCLGILELFNLLPASYIRSIIEYRSNPKFKEKYHLTLTAENLKFKTETIDSTLEWTHYNSYFETTKVFILVYGKRMYSIIPKRALDGTAQMEQIRELLQEVIPTINSK